MCTGLSALLVATSWTFPFKLTDSCVSGLEQTGRVCAGRVDSPYKPNLNATVSAKAAFATRLLVRLSFRHPACPLSLAQRHSGGKKRIRRRRVIHWQQQPAGQKGLQQPKSVFIWETTRHNPCYQHWRRSQKMRWFQPDSSKSLLSVSLQHAFTFNVRLWRRARTYAKCDSILHTGPLTLLLH